MEAGGSEDHSSVSEETHESENLPEGLYFLVFRPVSGARRCYQQDKHNTQSEEREIRLLFDFHRVFTPMNNQKLDEVSSGEKTISSRKPPANPAPPFQPRPFARL